MASTPISNFMIAFKKSSVEVRSTAIRSLSSAPMTGHQKNPDLVPFLLKNMPNENVLLLELAEQLHIFAAWAGAEVAAPLFERLLRTDAARKRAIQSFTAEIELNGADLHFDMFNLLQTLMLNKTESARIFFMHCLVRVLRACLR